MCQEKVKRIFIKSSSPSRSCSLAEDSIPCCSRSASWRLPTCQRHWSHWRCLPRKSTLPSSCVLREWTPSLRHRLPDWAYYRPAEGRRRQSIVYPWVRTVAAQMEEPTCAPPGGSSWSQRTIYASLCPSSRSVRGCPTDQRDFLCRELESNWRTAWRKCSHRSRSSQSHGE